MDILAQVPLEKLAYRLHDKPLLIGGVAMEYYGLRKAGADIDLVVSARDHANLKRRIPTTSRTCTAISASASSALRSGTRSAGMTMKS